MIPVGLYTIIIFMGMTTIAKADLSGQLDVISTSASDVSSDVETQYSCKFINMWSMARHPQDYPSNAHWSPPILVSHDPSFSMWAEGQPATTDLEAIAEEGDAAPMVSSVGSSSSTEDYSLGSVQFNNVAQMQTLPTITVSPQQYLLSAATMIAPSPDWFSGFYDVDMRTGANDGFWYESIVLETYPWDASTEGGTTFDGSGNLAETEGNTIFRITPTTGAGGSNNIFVENGAAATEQVLPVARWECNRETTDSCGSSCTFLGLSSGRMKLDLGVCVDLCIPDMLQDLFGAILECGSC